MYVYIHVYLYATSGLLALCVVASKSLLVNWGVHTKKALSASNARCSKDIWNTEYISKSQHSTIIIRELVLYTKFQRKLCNTKAPREALHLAIYVRVVRMCLLALFLCVGVKATKQNILRYSYKYKYIYEEDERSWVAAWVDPKNRNNHRIKNKCVCEPFKCECKCSKMR